MDYAQALWLYLILLFGIIVVPGMDMFFVLANALTRGRKAGFAAVAGIMLGGAVHTLFGALAVGVLTQLPTMLFQAMILVGAAYMAWIGYTLLRSSITVDTIGGAQGGGPDLVRKHAEASRKEAGNLRFDVLQHTMRANHFTVVEAWASRRAFEAHAAAAHTKQYREAMQPVTGSPIDERVYRSVE